jgi:hypothetical protein
MRVLLDSNVWLHSHDACDFLAGVARIRRGQYDAAKGEAHDRTDRAAAARVGRTGACACARPEDGRDVRLIRQDVYERVRKRVDGLNHRGWGDPADEDLIRKQA